jgi:hypothetical protein
MHMMHTMENKDACIISLFSILENVAIPCITATIQWSTPKEVQRLSGEMVE